MSFDYGSSAATADKLIRRFGAAVAITRDVPGEYDPATGETSGDVQSIIYAQAVVFDYPQGNIEGSLIRSGDRKAIVSAVGISAPQVGDVFPWQGDSLTVVSVKTLGPAGLAVIYTCQVRK